MKEFHLRIRTPFEIIWDGPAKSVSTKTEAGEVTLLSDHTNLISTITFSPTKIVDSHGTSEFLIRSGILKFDNKNNVLNILCQVADKKYESVYFNAIEHVESLKAKLANNESNQLNELQYAHLESEKVIMMEKIAYLEKAKKDNKMDKEDNN